MALRPEDRFSATVDDYAARRPSYPLALVDALVGALSVPPGARAVDLGAGTGISTRLFAARGLTGLVGVEPNAAMRAGAGPGTPLVDGTAEALPFERGTVYAALAAQSFHWFRHDEALAALAATLVPGGRLAIVWNLRDASPFLDAYQAWLERLESYRAVPRVPEVRARVERDPRVRLELRLEAPHAQRLDRAGFIGRARSSSYVAHAERPWSALEPELHALFDAHAVEGEVTFAYRAVASVVRFA
jgi:SAM-dependent methyltransferase